MQHGIELDRYSPDELNALHDRSHRLAPQLRRETMDLVWQGIVDSVSAQRLAAQRAASRFARSLARHARWRAAAQQRAACDGLQE